MVAAPQPRRGEIWWAVVDKRRPVVVVQADFLNRSAMDWILSVPLTGKLHHAAYPGNVRLKRRETGLPRICVANVAMVAPVHRSAFQQRVAALPVDRFVRVVEGLRLVLGLQA